MPSEDLLLEKRNALKKQFDKLTEKVAYLRVEFAALAAGSRKFELEQDIKSVEEELALLDDQIKEIDEQRRNNETVRLLSAMREMDYVRQTNSFRYYLTKRQIGAFLIHGAEKHGHLWALSRLRSTITPRTTSEPIPFDISSPIGPKDVPGMWRELARRFGVSTTSPPDLMRERVLEKVSGWLKTKNLIIFVFNVSNAGPMFFDQIAKQFWSPLANAAQGALLENHESKLMMFLVDNEDQVEQWGVMLENLENKDDFLKLPPASDFLIRLPALCAFDKDIVMNWMKQNPGDCLPPDIMFEVETYAQKIMDESNGVPESVAHCIFRLCKYEYMGEKIWMDL